MLVSKIKREKFRLLVLALAVVCACSLTAWAQDADATAREAQLDAQLRAKRKEKEIAELEKDIAEAKKATLKASLPSSNVTALEGKTELTVERGKESTKDVSMESESLSYKALTDIASALGGQINAAGGDVNRLVIFNRTDNYSILSYKIFNGQVDSILQSYQTLLTPQESKAVQEGMKGISGATSSRGLSGAQGLLMAPEIGTSLVKSAIDLISLFRTDTKIEEHRVDIDETALVAAVASELRRANPRLKVVYPDMYSTWLTTAVSEDPHSVVNRLSRLYQFHAYTSVHLADLESRADRSNAAERPRITALRALNNLVTDFIKDLLESKDGKPNLLTHVLRAENISRLLAEDKTKALYVRVVQAGGSHRISRNLITGSKVRYSGAAIVEYMLFDADGTIRDSKTLYSNTGFTKMDATSAGGVFNNLGNGENGKRAGRN